MMCFKSTFLTPTTTNILALSALTGLSYGHMELSWPYPIHSKFDPANSGSSDIDYSMTEPLKGDGKL